ncbi:MAG: hypothetical protein IKO72_14445 [Kiritimatiellae bacterium]|nr:hypothetical protein [Kiritimatiellia bacterium]
MGTKKKTSQVEAEVLHDIRTGCDSCFYDHLLGRGFTADTFLEDGGLTGEFLAKKLKSVEAQCTDVDIDDVKIVISCDNVTYPVLLPVVTTWKKGLIFKKTIRCVFFVWHSEVTDDSAAITLAEFNGFLNSKGLEDFGAAVNWIGVAASEADIAEIREAISREAPWLGLNVRYELGYNLKSITFDKANMALVFKIESRE